MSSARVWSFPRAGTRSVGFNPPHWLCIPGVPSPLRSAACSPVSSAFPPEHRVTGGSRAASIGSATRPSSLEIHVVIPRAQAPQHPRGHVSNQDPPADGEAASEESDPILDEARGVAMRGPKALRLWLAKRAAHEIATLEPHMAALNEAAQQDQSGDDPRNRMPDKGA